MSDSSQKTFVNAVPPPNGVETPESAGAKELCSKCRELDLTVERFIINDQVDIKKVKNTLLPRPSAPRVSDFLVKSQATTHSLGSMGDILAKSRACPLCSLLIKSISDPASGLEPKTYAALDAVCSVNWEIDGHQAHSKRAGTKKGRARRLRVQWNDERLKDSYLVFLLPEKYRRPNSDASAVWSKDSPYLGRNIDVDGGKQALMKSWIDICCKSHGRPCGRPTSETEFIEMARDQSFFGVIDVVDLQLKPLPTRPREEGRPIRHAEFGNIRVQRGAYEPYVALSYVWGRNQAYTTTAKNISLHLRHGGLEKHLKSLPRAVQDAIQLVHSLGLRYLWVDALCIVQDRPRSWNLNARVMDLIYGNAIVTVCAADGEDSSTGLVAWQPSAPFPQQWEVCAPGVTLMVTRPPETSIRRSTWNHRAWTFQERLLSPRCLIFVDGRVYFQCRSSGMSEDIVADRNGDGWSLDLVHAPLQMLREMESSSISVYSNCVDLYTSRHLTQAKDVLAAFNGITNYMRGSLQAPFIFGLPSSHFDFALLWEQTGSFKRRRPRTEEERRQYNGVEFPSWSWCGWMDLGEGNSIKYKHDMLEGVLINLNQWLLNHTWIRWHIRDGHGKLRPLWGQLDEPEATTDERWKGYQRGIHRPPYELNTGKDLIEYHYDNDNHGRQGDGDQWEIGGEEQEEEEDKDYEDVEVLDRSRSRSHAKLERKAKPRPRSGRRHRDPSGYPEVYPYDMQETNPRRNGRHREHNYIDPNAYGGGLPNRNGRHREPVYINPGAYGEVLPPRRHHRDNNPYHVEDHRVIDEYGRFVPAGLTDPKKYEFHLTLPEVPYRVLLETTDAEPSVEFPDQPILQFFTYYSTLNLIPTDSANPNPGPGLCRYDIADDMGDWCGSLVLEESWIQRTEFSKQEFIAISDAKAFTHDECNTWTYYIPKEREESEWDLYHVLLIAPSEWGYQRVALGKVFKAAFADAQWKEIMLR